MGIDPEEKNRQEYCSGLPSPPPGDLPNPGIKPRSPHWRQILYHLSLQGNSNEARNTEVHVCLQRMVFSWYLPRGLQFFKRYRNKLPRKQHIGQSQRKHETWNFGFLFPGCHGQLCVPSTEVLAVSTYRHRSSLQDPCLDILLGGSIAMAWLSVHTDDLRLKPL